MIEGVITDEFLSQLFPPERADEFFEALYGGAETGAFDIALKLRGFNESENLLFLDFVLTERPGKCMACSLTYGLPPVFQRHPVININGMIKKIEEKLKEDWIAEEWSLGSTTVVSKDINCIPLVIKLKRRQ